MRKLAIYLVGLLLVGMVFAEDIPTAVVTSVTPEPISVQTDSRAADIPLEIPLAIVSAEAEEEYIAVVCAMARYNMQRFIDGIDIVKGHFDDIVTSMNQDYPGTLTLDTSVISPVKTEMQEKLDALCAATPETYASAIQGVIDLSMGGNGLESRMQGLGESLQTQMESKVSEFQTQAESYQEQARTFLGGRTYEEAKPLLDELQAKQAQLQALQTNPPTTQEEGMALQSLATEVQSLTAEIGITADSQVQAEALIADAQAFGVNAQAFGSKAETVFGSVSEKMEAAFNQRDYSDLKALATEVQYRLFLKIFEKNMVDVGGIKARLESSGIDASVLDEVTSWIADKKEEAKSVFTADASEASIIAWAMQAESEGLALEAKMNELIENEVSTKWINDFETLRANAETGILAAKDGGLDTTVVEGYMSELESIRSEALELKAEGLREEALDKIQEADAKIVLLKAEYAKLQAMGAEAKASAEAAASALEAQESVIRNLITVAKEKGLDTSVIESLVEQLYALKDEASASLLSGDNASALDTLSNAKELFSAVKIEFERLKGELA